MHDLAVKRGYTPHIRARGEEIKLKARTPGWRARRWVVEATHSCHLVRGELQACEPAVVRRLLFA